MKWMLTHECGVELGLTIGALLRRVESGEMPIVRPLVSCSEGIRMDDYEWDVFISYRRYEQWKLWLDKFFVPFLERALQPELRTNDKPHVFVDRKNLKEGYSWPDNLRNSLARSRVMIPLLCAGYWDSEWCKKELAIMLERERLLGFRQPNKPNSLIIPVIIHDGSRIPQAVSIIQSFNATKFVRTYLSNKAGLEILVGDIAARVAEHHRGCPAFDPGWLQLTGQSILSELAPREDGPNGFPRFT